MQIQYIEAFFLDDSKNELTIVAEGDEIGKYDLYWTYDQNPQTENKKYLLTSDQKKLVFEFTCSREKRTYFIIEFADRRPILFGHRILPVDGMFNFRDIGGYRTTDGKRLKWGVGFRSDHLCNASELGREYLKSLHLKSVIDFRSPNEVTENPNPMISDETKSYNFDPQAHTAMVAGAAQSMDANEYMFEKARKAIRKGEDGSKQMKEQQLRFVSSKDSQAAFAATLRVLADRNNAPSVQHCRGGKDRTGFALMLLEGLLGVPEELLVYDYMLTHRAREKKNDSYYRHFLEKTGDKAVAQYLYSLYDTKAEFIEASYSKILNEFGSVKNYVTNVLGLKEEEIQELRTIFLEEE